MSNIEYDENFSQLINFEENFSFEKLFSYS